MRRIHSSLPAFQVSSGYGQAGRRAERDADTQHYSSGSLIIPILPAAAAAPPPPPLTTTTYLPPVKEFLETPTKIPLKLPELPSSLPVVNSELVPSNNSTTTTTTTSTPVSSNKPAPAPALAASSRTSAITITITITIPSYSRWFSWDTIHECERRFLPEFFDSKSPPFKNPVIYKCYRDSIITKFRLNPSKKITFTEVRKVLIGDVGSIRRVFDFLEGWGLVNYTAAMSMSSSSSKQHQHQHQQQQQQQSSSKWEEKGNNNNNNNKSSAVAVAGEFGAATPYESLLSKKETSTKFCSGCKTVCSIACFVSDKFDLTLCARCYVRGNYRVGVDSSDFRRVEISEETKSGWTEKETLQLLEAVMHYGDDWKKVTEHVGGRSQKECVARFTKLPFGEQFVGPPVFGEEVDKYYLNKEQRSAETGAENILPSSPAKRRCLTPLADSSNPIMAQAAFLSAMVGSEVVEAAARAAVAVLSEDLTIDHIGIKENTGSLLDVPEKPVSAAIANGDGTLEETIVEAESFVEKEEQDLARSISGIIEVQTKEIQDKIVRFEGFELQMEKEWKQLNHMKHQLFTDQLSFVFHRTAPLTNKGSVVKEGVKTTDDVK